VFWKVFKIRLSLKGINFFFKVKSFDFDQSFIYKFLCIYENGFFFFKFNIESKDLIELRIKINVIFFIVS